MSPFKPIEQCSTEGRSQQTVASDLDGTLLLSRSAFPYYLLVALEAGGPSARSRCSCPCPSSTSRTSPSPSPSPCALLYIAVAGLEVRDVESVARSVLPRFYAGDVHPEGWRVFSSFGRRCVVTASPRVMVEPFARAFLGADRVIGTELEVGEDGRATGFVAKPGVLIREHKRNAVVRGVRRRAAGRRHGGQGERLRLHGHLQGRVRRDHLAEAPAGAGEPAAENRRPPRRPPRPAPDGDQHAARLPLDAGRLRARAPPRVPQPAPPRARPLLRLQAHGRRARGARPPAAAGREPRRALRVQPPHRARPGRRRRRAGPQGDLRHVQRPSENVRHELQAPGGAHGLAGQGRRRAVQGARQGRGPCPAAAGGGRRHRRLPRGHHLPRGVPAAVQLAVRRAHRPHRAGGHRHQGDHVPRLHGARV
ncbi:hypothetical protein EE612_029863 [Oryza sativa]|nr:hypothetical protein EE612_029863 [Oryza sativa]